MTDEQLSRFTRAYREETSSDVGDGDAVLERIERSQRANSSTGRRTFRAIAFSLAAALVGSGAWAGATGRIGELVARVVGGSVWSLEQTANPDVGRRPVTSLAASKSPADAEPLLEAAPATEESAEQSKPALNPIAVDGRRTSETRKLARSRATRPGEVRHGVAAVAAPEGSAAEPTLPDVDALYRDAHDAQFKTHDYSAALDAWNVYLAHAGPGSRMLIEARYNRGISLARLGRGDAAIEALAPFAEGEYGEYRREDARRVIEKLRR